jgi:iron-sulfur cluster insertion protein
VQSLKLEEDNEELKLRVYVTGGGCSGFQYGFSFEDVMAEDDTAVTRGGVTVLIDSLSYQYLAGSTVDYEEGLMGSRFLITNPNASTTCGCGASFSI